MVIPVLVRTVKKWEKCWVFRFLIEGGGSPVSSDSGSGKAESLGSSDAEVGGGGVRVLSLWRGERRGFSVVRPESRRSESGSSGSEVRGGGGPGTHVSRRRSWVLKTLRGWLGSGSGELRYGFPPPVPSPPQRPRPSDLNPGISVPVPPLLRSGGLGEGGVCSPGCPGRPGRLSSSLKVSQGRKGREGRPLRIGQTRTY